MTRNSFLYIYIRLFGISGGIYDFTKIDLNESIKRIKLLSTREGSLSRNVDKNALERLDRYFYKFTMQSREKRNFP
jgi:hypothetical protein